MCTHTHTHKLLTKIKISFRFSWKTNIYMLSIEKNMLKLLALKLSSIEYKTAAQETGKKLVETQVIKLFLCFHLYYKNRRLCQSAAIKVS